MGAASSQQQAARGAAVGALAATLLAGSSASAGRGLIQSRPDAGERDLWLHVDFDADDAALEEAHFDWFREQAQRASVILCDATDGQVRIGKVFMCSGNIPALGTPQEDVDIRVSSGVSEGHSMVYSVDDDAGPGYNLRVFSERERARDAVNAYFGEGSGVPGLELPAGLPSAEPPASCLTPVELLGKTSKDALPPDPRDSVDYTGDVSTSFEIYDLVPGAPPYPSPVGPSRMTWVVAAERLVADLAALSRARVGAASYGSEVSSTSSVAVPRVTPEAPVADPTPAHIAALEAAFATPRAAGVSPTAAALAVARAELEAQTNVRSRVLLHVTDAGAHSRVRAPAQRGRVARGPGGRHVRPRDRGRSGRSRARGRGGGDLVGAGVSRAAGGGILVVSSGAEPYTVLGLVRAPS